MGENKPVSPAKNIVLSLDQIKANSTTVSNQVDTRLTSFYNEYLETLVAGLRKQFGGGPPEPEDIAQQAFQKLVERDDLSKIKNLQAFIWRIARNMILDHKRAQDVRSRYDFEVEKLYFPLKNDVSTPEDVLLVQEQLNIVKKIVDELPERRRQALLLNRIEGLSVTEVGKQLGISRPSAAAHIAKAMAKLSMAFIDSSSGSSK